jgi:hypothetical protein
MSMNLKRGMLLAILCGAGLLPPAVASAVEERITHTIDFPNKTETWKIEAPNVRQPITEYPQIHFQSGDHVRVDASGCVNVGGGDESSKRYVDPLGPNSDRLYHGMILIPGAIGHVPASLDTMARILIVRGHTYTVGRLADPRTAYLRLGYEDDNYSDNGYEGQDSGSQGQCVNQGNAVVVLTIVHGRLAPQAGLPFDLFPQTFDDNAIPLNPKWAWQLPPRPPFPNPANFPDPIGQCHRHPENPQCTSQDTDEDKAFLCAAWDHDGHYNWGAGTYVGTIFWNDKSARIADDDYNFRLVPPEGAGLNASNGKVSATQEKSMKLEFDARETINHFKTKWWDSFHKAVDQGFSEANSMVFQKLAIVTGLIGTDCAHSCATELHPVWAMAIRVQDDPADETWAIFVRRWGNEGFCGDKQHYLTDLQGDEFVFRLPWRPGATGLGVLPTTVFQSRYGQATMNAIVWKPGDSVLVSFKLPVPESGEGERVNGELHLQWSGHPRKRPPPRPGELLRLRDDDDKDEPEHIIVDLVAGMRPEQRAIFEARFPREEPSFDSAPVPMLTPPRRLPTMPKHLPRTQMPRAKAVPDAATKALGQQRVDALRAVYGEIPPPPREVHPR